MDDDDVMAVASFVKDFATDGGLPSKLTARELALIEQSRENFRAGRVVTQEEYRAYIDDAHSAVVSREPWDQAERSTIEGGIGGDSTVRDPSSSGV